MKINSKHSLESSFEFVSHYWSLFKQTTRAEIKQALSDTLVTIFRNLIDTFSYADSKPNLNFSEWFNLMKKVHESTDPKKSRKKTPDMNVSIVAVSLKVLDVLSLNGNVPLSV